MRSSSASILALMTLALVACDRPSDTRVPAVAPEAVKAASSTSEPAPLAIRTDVNAAEQESIMKSIAASAPAQPSKDGADQGLHVAAQDAAAKAPDTASADAAKKRVLESGKDSEGASAPNNPQSAELSKSDESTAMPKPGQANDHSSEGPANAYSSGGKQGGAGREKAGN